MIWNIEDWNIRILGTATYEFIFSPISNILISNIPKVFTKITLTKILIFSLNVDRFSISLYKEIL